MISQKIVSNFWHNFYIWTARKENPNGIIFTKIIQNWILINLHHLVLVTPKGMIPTAKNSWLRWYHWQTKTPLNIILTRHLAHGTRADWCPCQWLEDLLKQDGQGSLSKEGCNANCLKWRCVMMNQMGRPDLNGNLVPDRVDNYASVVLSRQANQCWQNTLTHSLWCSLITWQGLVNGAGILLVKRKCWEPSILGPLLGFWSD